jgi:hypothetical protein
MGSSLNHLANFDENVYEDDNIDSDSDSMLFRLVASTIPKWRTFKLLRRVQILNRLVDLDEIFVWW